MRSLFSTPTRLAVGYCVVMVVVSVPLAYFSRSGLVRLVGGVIATLIAQRALERDHH